MQKVAMSIINLNDFRIEGTTTGRVSASNLTNSNTPKAAVHKLPLPIYTLKTARERDGYFTSARMLDDEETSQAAPKYILMPGLPLTATLYLSRDFSQQPDICKFRELKVVYHNAVTGAEVGFALFDLLSSTDNLHWNSDYFIEMDGHSASGQDFHEILSSNFGHICDVLCRSRAVGFLNCVEFKDTAREGVGMAALQLTMKHLRRYYGAQLFVFEVYPIQFETYVKSTPPAGETISSAKEFNSAMRKLTQLYTKKLGAQKLPSGALAVCFDLELAQSYENSKLVSIS